MQTLADGSSQYKQLRHFLYWLTAIIVASVLIFAISAVIIADVAMGLIGMIGGVYTVILAMAWRLLRHQKLDLVIMLICSGMLTGVLFIAFVQPAFFPSLVIIPILVVSIALPYTSGQRLKYLIFASLVVLLAICVVGITVPSPFGEPPTLFSLLSVGVTIAEVGLTFLLLWQYHQRLMGALFEARTTNDALRLSEERFRRLAENAADIIYRYRVHPTPGLEYISPAVTQILGYSVDECYIRPELMNEVIHPDDQDRMSMLFQSEDMWRAPLELRCLHRNGAVIWTEQRIVPVLNEQGVMIALEGISRDITARKQTEEELQLVIQEKEQTLALLDTLLENTPIGMAFLDTELMYVRVNSTLAAIASLPVESYIGQTMQNVPLEFDEHSVGYLRQVLETGLPVTGLEIRNYAEEFLSDQRSWLVSYYPVCTESAEILGVGVVVIEITERKRLEAQLFQAQKMRSIGQLAGGIAHDFNNLLTAIIGYTDIAQMTLPKEHPIQDDLHHIQEASNRATRLTRQLLAFARRQVIEPRVIDLNALIVDMDTLLRRLIGADIDLVTLPKPNLAYVRVDPGQIEQVLVNTVLNARDAMPDGGTLTIETDNVYLDATYTQIHIDVTVGQYVMLAITDTGIGMDNETKQHIFEPFFSTKPEGKGTGLGLATCYGIVKQHNGSIWVYSELGRGTTFKIYLPYADQNIDEIHEHNGQALETFPQGSETIMVVEDDTSVCELAVQVLRNRGYRVLTASNGEEALLAAQEFQHEIHLLLVDIVMPRMGGYELAQRFKVLFPETKVLFTSGYTDNVILDQDESMFDMAFIQKPFSPVTLARQVRDILGTDTPDLQH